MFPIFSYPFSENLPILDAMKRRTSPPSDKMEADIRHAYEQVTAKGEKAITEYTAKFDYADFKDSDIFVPLSHVDQCIANLKPELKAAIELADHNIGAVNKKIVEHMKSWDISIADGHDVGERPLPMDKVLLWTPARKGPLISTAIMLCNAAKTAGVKQIIVATPPSPSGEINGDTIAAARMAGATDVVCGNALSVIACAATGNWRYGRVNAIFGPGPDAVALTMLQAARYGIVTQPGIGPSDALIVFDKLEAGEEKILARDVLTETEHGVDSYTYALTTNEESAKRLQAALEDERGNLFGKEEQYAKLAENGGAAIVVFKNKEDLIAFANAFSAEHLMVFMEHEEANAYADRLTGASEVLVGKNIPFSSANYIVGVTAVLPTNGFARSYSGVTSRQFMRWSTRAELSKEAFQRLVPAIEAIGAGERLPNHGFAGTVRKKLNM